MQKITVEVKIYQRKRRKNKTGGKKCIQSQKKK